MLVAYTDGLCETSERAPARNGAGRDFQETVEAARRSRRATSWKACCECAEAFAGGAPQRDDVTLWVGKVDEAVAEPLHWRSAAAELVAA